MATQQEYDQYIERYRKLINSLLADMGARPVIFVGSGMTRRYLNGPSWVELLAEIAKMANVSDSEFAFLSQKASGDPITLGSLLSEEVHRWAFGLGKNSFPVEYFEPGSSRDNFIKHLASQVLNGLAANIDHLSDDLKAEIASLVKIAPHAIITTNFDGFLEQRFPDYELVIGEQIIPLSLTITGELYKIHGTTSDPSSLVLTSRDYDRFMQKRRYISSKLMTYFAEYPVFVFGYGFNDTNVNSIIGDLGEALKDKGGLLENVFLVKRVRDLEKIASLQEEHAIPARDPLSPGLRVRTILTKDFKWLFDELGNTANPLPVPLSTLRHLASRVVDLVRVDVPKNKVEIDFEQVKKLSDHPEELAMVLGIGNVKSPSMTHPYSLTEVGRALGFKSWHKANDLIKATHDALGYDLKASDNDFHMSVRVGTGPALYHKYSDQAIDLLRKTKANGEGMI